MKPLPWYLNFRLTDNEFISHLKKNDILMYIPTSASDVDIITVSNAGPMLIGAYIQDIYCEEIPATRLALAGAMLAKDKLWRNIWVELTYDKEKKEFELSVCSFLPKLGKNGIRGNIKVTAQIPL